MKKNEGSIVVISLVIAIAVLILLGVFLGSIVAERKNTQRSYWSTQALNLAEAGIEKAIWALQNEKIESSSWTNSDTVQLSGQTMGDFEVTLTSSVDRVTVVATGYAPGISIQQRAVRKIEVVMEKDLYDVFDYTLFGDKGGIELIENVYTDSYDSRLGSYEDQVESHPDPYEGTYALSRATVGTNSISPGAISLTDFASIYGDALVGPTGNISSAITITEDAKITGSQGTVASEVELPEVITPTDIDFDHSGEILNVKDTVEINTPGVYRYDSISVSGNGRLVISATAPVTFYVESDLNIQVDVTGNGVIEVATGCSVSFYVGGNMKVSGNGIVNYNKDPSTLAVYGTDKCESIQFVGNADFYGVVYARKAEISVVGNGGVYGCLIGNRIYVSGNGHIHYDEALKDSDDSFPEWAKDYQVVLWSEK